MRGKADLHIHTTNSDGKLPPAEIVKLANDKNLQIISITDHDTISGLEEAVSEGNKLGVDVIAGVEITSLFNDRETHLLGYCFLTDNTDLRSLLSHHKKARIKRAESIVHLLMAEGLQLDLDEVKAEARGGNVGRPHIASVLIKKGYVANAREAFIRYLGDHALGKIERDYCSYLEAIQTVKNAGGAVILAHPGVLYSEREIRGLIEAGIDGIEVIHPSHDYELVKKYEKMVIDYDLLATGGSDYHGTGGDYMHNFGTVTIGLGKVKNLVRMTDQRKNIIINQ